MDGTDKRWLEERQNPIPLYLSVLPAAGLAIQTLIAYQHGSFVYRPYRASSQPKRRRHRDSATPVVCSRSDQPPVRHSRCSPFHCSFTSCFLFPLNSRSHLPFPLITRPPHQTPRVRRPTLSTYRPLLSPTSASTLIRRRPALSFWFVAVRSNLALRRRHLP